MENMKGGACYDSIHNIDAYDYRPDDDHRTGYCSWRYGVYRSIRRCNRMYRISDMDYQASIQTEKEIRLHLRGLFPFIRAKNMPLYGNETKIRKDDYHV